MPKIQEIKEVWFDYPDDPMGGKVLIRHLKEGEVQKILETTTETRTVFNSDDGKPETVITRKDVVTALVLESVRNWENFYDGKKSKNNPYGKELKCTPDKIKLFCLEDGFVNFISDCREKLNAISLKENEEAEKNLNG